MSLRIGLVGAGHMGHVYMRSLPHVRGAEIVAVASPNTAGEFAQRWDIGHHFKDYRSMIEAVDLDAVAIAAPNDLHYDITLAAADAGKHVFCETPLAVSLEEADTMIAACRGAGVVLVYAENLAFAPMYEGLRERARRGAVGEPFLVKHQQSHGGPSSPWSWDIDRSGGGALLDPGCRSIHLICHVMGAWPEAVTAAVGRFAHAGRTLGDDHAITWLHFSSGRLGIAENSWAMPGGADYLEVCGPEGRLTANLGQGPAIAAYRDPNREGAEVNHAGWMYHPYAGDWEYGFPQELQHFVDVIAGEAELRSSGEDGRGFLEIVYAAYESARTGRRVALPFESDRERPIDHWLEE